MLHVEANENISDQRTLLAYLLFCDTCSKGRSDGNHVGKMKIGKNNQIIVRVVYFSALYRESTACR